MKTLKTGDDKRRVLIFSGGGILLGLALLGVHYGLSEPSPRFLDWLKLVVSEALGIGFIVSAVAIVLYEWGSQQAKNTRLTEKLIAVQGHLRNLTARQTERALDAALSSLFPERASEPENEKLSGLCREILVDTSNLYQEDHWTREAALSCMKEYLEQVRGNIKALSSLDLVHANQLFYTQIAPDALLKHLMNDLKENDRYDVVSHLDSWLTGSLKALHDAGRRALAGQVKVRRMFNLMRGCGPSSKCSVEKVFKDHIKLAEKFDNYEVKVLRREDLTSDGLIEVRQRMQGVQLVFFSNDDNWLRIEVVDPKLQKLTLSCAEGEVHEDHQLFESAWEAADPLRREYLDQYVEEAIGYYNLVVNYSSRVKAAKRSEEL